MSSITFLEMTEVFFDLAGLAAFGRELDAHGQALACSVKGGATAIATETRLTASAALELLRSGQAIAAQLRYGFDGFQWTDTILRTPEPGQFKLIRSRSA